MRHSYFAAAAMTFSGLLCLLGGCGRAVEPLSVTGFKLDTIVSIQAYDRVDSSVLSEALALCDDYSGIFSRTDPDSELYLLNEAAKKEPLVQYPVSDSLGEVLAEGLACAKRTEGAFDITIEPVSSLWDFSSDTPEVPRTAEIEKALLSIGWQDVMLTRAGTEAVTPETGGGAKPGDGAEMNGTAGADGGWHVSTTRAGMGFDVGAVAKGYIADRIREFLLQHGVSHAVINLGGNVLCVGSKPDGSPFHIGVRQPFAPEQETALVLQADDLSVVTAGIYERCFKQDGLLYHHILNPGTGYPYDNSIASVTIVSPLSLTGDALSTACFALGPDRGLALIENTQDAEAAVLLQDGTLRYSSGFQKYILSE